MRAIEQHLFRRVGEVVGAANDVGDAHVDVVDDDAQLVGGHAPLFGVFAGAQEDEVFDFGVVEFAVAEDGVGEVRFRRSGTRKRMAGFTSGIRGFAVAAAAANDAANFFDAGGAVGGVISAGVFFGGAVAEEGAAVGEAFLGGVVVEGEALRLVERAFVPVEAEPLKAVDDALDEFGLVALGVGVFDAEDHGAALLAGEEPVEESGAGAADVEIAGGGWGEADADGIGGVGHDFWVRLN